MEKNVRILRAESALTDLVREAIGSLGNEMINSLSITRVECSRGISDAAVYILDENFSENEKRKIISELKKSGSYIARYCTATGAIAKMPKMTFCFDDSMEKEKRLTEILGSVKKDG